MRFCGYCGVQIDAPAHPPAVGSAQDTLVSDRVSGGPPPPRSGTTVSSSLESRTQEERRLVTALFCDLVGFTPLSESLGPEDARYIQAEYFAAMKDTERVEDDLRTLSAA
jgi:class 3 adenylate cyclase